MYDGTISRDWTCLVDHRLGYLCEFLFLLLTEREIISFFFVKQIWTYEHGRDAAYFDGLNHLIVSVGLVKPKPGVFIADVKYLLILTTPIEIVVLGVTFGDSTKSSTETNFSEMQLMNKPIFIVNTDVAITTVVGTKDQRIFLGGRDGCLYEISYRAESTWLGKRCWKVNHSQGLMSYMVPGFLKVFSVSVVH